MVSDASSGEEPKQEKRKELNDDVLMFMRKHSETEPRYTAKLKTYLDIQEKRGRAAAARKQLYVTKNEPPPMDEKLKTTDKTEKTHNPTETGSRVRKTYPASAAGVGAEEPDECCLARRRRRRRRSCGRRRRKSCGRRRRRRRRSCSRRRRRRSCRRRRRRRRGCGCK